MAENTTTYTRGYRSRLEVGGAYDKLWMPDNVTTVIRATGSDRIAVLHENKPGITLNYGERDALPAKRNFEVDLECGAPIILGDGQVLTLPSGSVKNTWEGSADNTDPIAYLESPEDAVKRQIKGELAHFIGDVTIIPLGGSYVKPANSAVNDKYYAIEVPEEFVPGTEGIDPSIKNCYWVPFKRALQLVIEGVIDHDPACQAIMRDAFRRGITL